MSNASQALKSCDTDSLRLYDVTVSYNRINKNINSNHIVLRKLNLSIRNGEFVIILGPSGCGKSTLLNVIAGMSSAYDGKIEIDNKPISEASSTDRVVVFQEGALFPWLTVFDNIEFGLKIAKVPKINRRKKVRHLIDVVGLTNFTNAFIHQLSGGMKQKVAIARALALNPKILLMDEPFAALDVQTRNTLHNHLLKIHNETKKTILFVTHNIDEAVALGDRIVILSPKLANIKKEFIIDIPRPRNMDNNSIVKEIRKEIASETKSLLSDNGYVLSHDQESEYRFVASSSIQ